MKERKGKERKGKERKGKERKGKERKGKGEGEKREERGREGGRKGRRIIINFYFLYKMMVLGKWSLRIHVI